MSMTDTEAGLGLDPRDAAFLRQLRGQRVALVHDWLTGMRGGEKVLREIARLVPQADLYTLIHVRGSVDPVVEDRRVVASWLDRIPGIEKHYRWWLPFFPSWVDRLDLSDYDLVLSTSHCVAKGARARRHVCYCHTPMRYVWDRFEDYFGHLRGPRRWLIEGQARRLREWDRRTAGRVDRYLANSRFVRDRILRFYPVADDQVSVVYPPVETERFASVEPPPRRERYLVVSALVPYKRIDHAVEACARSGRPLDVAGTGPELTRLRARAEALDADVRWLGFVSDDELPGLMASRRALLFPGVEDFGITPVEATAAGLPVIARGMGGALDTVRPQCNGVLYEGDGVEALIEALDRFEAVETEFDPEAMRAWAARFSCRNFLRSYLEEVRAGLS